MIRQFILTNAAGVSWSFNRPEYCFLHEPKGLGYAETANYQRLGTAWVAEDPEAQQADITGEVVFTGSDPYVAYKAFGKFLRATPLVLTYTTDAGTVYRDVSAARIEKTEIVEHFLLRCPITLTCRSLWYGLTYAQQIGEPAILTDATPDQLTDASGNVLVTTEPDYSVLNDGDTDAPFTLQVSGATNQPTLTVTGPDGDTKTVTFPVDLAATDTLYYSSIDGDLYCYVEDGNGDQTNLVPQFPVGSYIFLKIPAGLSTVEILGSDVQLAFRQEYRRA